MTEREIAEIVERHHSKRWYSVEPSQESKAIAKEIYDQLARERTRATYNPPKFTAPSVACDCGAERINPTAKHAPWCSLISPRPRRF